MLVGATSLRDFYLRPSATSADNSLLVTKSIVNLRALIPTIEQMLNSKPILPLSDAMGRFPALEYARVSLARDIVRDRRAAGLTQQELADLAKTRQETISRIESGKYTASVKLIDRIDDVLQAALKARIQKNAKRKAKRGRGN
jgi:DNA-binding XRE family transcriptional regulator